MTLVKIKVSYIFILNGKLYTHPLDLNPRYYPHRNLWEEEVLIEPRLIGSQEKSFENLLIWKIMLLFSSHLTRSKAESIDDEQPRVEKLSLKKRGLGSEARAERMANADVDLQLLGEGERGRQLQKQKKRRLQGREEDVSYELWFLFVSSFLS